MPISFYAKIVIQIKEIRIVYPNRVLYRDVSRDQSSDANSDLSDFRLWFAVNASYYGKFLRARLPPDIASARTDNVVVFLSLK